MKKIFYQNKIINRIIATTLLLILILNLMIPIKVRAANEAEAKFYEEWMALLETEKLKETFKNDVVQMILATGKLGPTHGNGYDENEVAEVYLSQPNCVVVYAKTKTKNNGKIKSIEVVTIGFKSNGNEGGNEGGNESVEFVDNKIYKYQELLDWTGITEEELDKEIVPKIQYFYNISPDDYYAGSETTQDVAQNILNLNRKTILLTVSGTKDNYQIIKVEIPDKDANTVLQESYDSLGMIEDEETYTDPYKSDNLINKDNATGIIDSYAGIILEPTVELVLFITDAIMSVFSSFMTQNDFEFVMVFKDKISTLPNQGNIGTTITISDMMPYATVSGNLDLVRYPNFSFTPEQLFAGEIDLVDVNFIYESNDDKDWLSIRRVVSQWYQILRIIAIIGLLSVLIYTGIKIILSSSAQDKAKYKELIINWIIAVILAFSMHYLMAFILSVIEELTSLLKGITGGIQVNAGGVSFVTNLMGLARFQVQQTNFSSKVGYLIMYIALVVYTFKFTFVYFKRLLKMAFLTIVSPIVALTYPIDKMNDGRAQGFNMWLKEFIFNALLQPMHYLLYYILVSSALTLAARNPLYGIAALAFISQAEKLLKKIFGFDKAKAGTVGGLTGAFTTGALSAAVINYAKDPLHPFAGGNKDNKKDGKESEKSNDNYYDEDAINFVDDTTREDDLLSFISNTNNYQLTQNNLGRVVNSNSRDQMIQMLETYEQNGGNLDGVPALESLNDQQLSVLVQDRVIGNSNGISLGNSFSNNTFSYSGVSLPTSSEKPQSAWNRLKQEYAPVRGIANVGRNIAKPVWDTQKDWKYNTKRLAKNVGKGVTGAAIGVTAAAVQAGISITDGKYNPIEGVGTIAAGIAGTSAAIDSINNKKEIDPQDKKTLEKYTQQWFNRDDVINKYNMDYPGEGKDRRTRAAKNYVSRGITDLKQQKEAMKFADLIKKERGLDEDEADKIAVATLQYKQGLSINKNYDILFDEKKRNDYLDVKADSYVGSASKNSIKRLHQELIENVRDFDRANK